LLKEIISAEFTAFWVGKLRVISEYFQKHSGKPLIFIELSLIMTKKHDFSVQNAHEIDPRFAQNG